MEAWLILANYGCEGLLKTQVSYMSVMITVLVTVLALLGLFIPIWNIDRMEKLKEKTAGKIDKLKEKIEDQRKNLKDDIEEDFKKQTAEFSEDFESVYMDMSIIILRLYGLLHKKDYSKNDFLADLFRLLSISLNHAFRSKNDENIVTILKTMISVEIPKNIDEETHDLFMKKLPEIEDVIERHPDLKESFREKLLKPIINAKVEDAKTDQSESVESARYTQADAKQQLLEYVGKLNAEEAGKALSVLKVMFGEK